jgi:hypothetical protein
MIQAFLTMVHLLSVLCIAERAERLEGWENVGMIGFRAVLKHTLTDLINALLGSSLVNTFP